MKKQNILITLLLIIFIVITYFVITKQTIIFDKYFYENIIQIRNNFFDEFFKSITKLGNTIIILIVVIILLLKLNKENRELLGINTIITVLINIVIKNIIKRPRPNILRLIKQSGYSYPSGHSMIAIATYGYLIYVVNKNIKNKSTRILLTIFLLFIILGIGISRIYLGVHYPSDVLGGYVLALLIEIIVIKTYKKNFKGE